MTTASTRLPVLFLTSALGVLLLVGVLLGDVLGWPAAAAYSVVVLAALVLLVRRLRPTAPPSRDHSGCACCSGEPFRGVEIVP